MYVPEKLKLNRFRVVAVPSNREYFASFGGKLMDNNSYTGDKFAPTPMNKVESIVDYQQYAEEEAAKQS